MQRLLLPCVLFVCAFLCSFDAFAAKGSIAVRKQVESSMLVTGTIDITPAGDVVAHALDKPEKLPKGIVEMAARIVPEWKFEPVTLKNNAISRSKMNLLFVAKKRDDGRYDIDLRSASFSGDEASTKITIAPTGNAEIKYPLPLARSGVSGSVYLELKIGRDGKVADIAASHVNLRVIGAPADMQRWRGILERSSIATVKQWAFVVPQTAPEEGDYWFGTLPINFIMENERIVEYGRWETYVAGPRTLIPWLDDKKIAGNDSDALTPNLFHAAGSGRRLLTPLTGG